MPPKRRLAAAALAAALAACGAHAPEPAGAGPAGGSRPAGPPAAVPSPGLPVFVDVAQEAGLAVVNHSGAPGTKEWIASANGGGAIVLDYDCDGRMDLVVVDGTMLTTEGELQFDDAWRTRLFHNDGAMRFTDVTKQAGIDIRAFGFGGASCDYDGDGWPDFYVCCWGRNFLMRNRGDGTFEDATAKAGVGGDPREWSSACAFGDLDGDGVADLYVANYLDQRAVIDEIRGKGRVGGRWANWRGVKVYVGPTGLPGQEDRLYFGNGDGTFRDVTRTDLGPQDPPRYGYQPVMTDLDGDGHLDVYVANDAQPNLLWMNDGHGRFTDRAVEAGVAFDFDGRQQASMGVDAADFDRDGWIDLVVTNLDFDHNTLYVNQTGRTRRISFRDVSGAHGLSAPSYRRVSWGTRLFDYDGDGELDFFAACGHVYGEVDGFEATTGASYRQSCLLQHNTGAPRFQLEDVTDRSGPAFAQRRVWRGAAFADFDDDGDLDVFVTALNDRAALFRNDGGNGNGFLAVRLVGRRPLTDAAGARVTVTLADGRSRMEELHHGASFACDNDPRLFFGLASAGAAKSVEVRWPNGEKQTFADVAGRRFYVLEQGAAALREDRR